MQIEPETTPRFAAGLLGHRTFRQLVKFGLVGATGFIINVSVFAFCLRVLEVHYRLAYVFAFCVAVTNNFLLNRYWTFKATHVTAAVQAPRFFVVSLGALALNLVALHVLISVFALQATSAQAVAIALATPISFAGNKLWSFSRRTELST